MTMTSDKSLSDLAMDAVDQVGHIIRNEVRLARAEASESVRSMSGAFVKMALGVAFACAAITLALFALAYALGESMPMWGAALIAALVGAIAGYALMQSGRKALAHDALDLPRTKAQVAQDIKIIKEKVSP